MTLNSTVAAICLFAFATPLLAQTHTTPYAGQQTREIVSLSEDDMVELREGRGWGLARAAELNGVPGPSHLLELREEIGLTPDQVAGIIAIRDTMRSEAVAAGALLISAEKALDQAFKSGTPDAVELEKLVQAAGKARSDLRLIHLSAHLTTPSQLSGDQIARYNMLRGYAEDACEKTPEGHDPVQWRRHNGCD